MISILAAWFLLALGLALLVGGSIALANRGGPQGPDRLHFRDCNTLRVTGQPCNCRELGERLP